MARIWCPLCLGVQAVLIIEAAWVLTGPLLPIATTQVFAALLAFALAALGWVLLRPVLESAQEQRGDHQELMAFKRNPILFGALLRRQELMPTLPTDLRTVWLGQPDAPHVLTIVTNPYCGPCKQQHKDIETLLGQSSAVRVRLIFFTSEVASDNVTRLARHLLALDPARVHEALTTWFTQSHLDYEVWVQHFPLLAESDEAQSMAVEHGRWCRSVGVTATPTVFFDGYRFPALYRLADMAWLFSYEPNQPVSQ